MEEPRAAAGDLEDPARDDRRQRQARRVEQQPVERRPVAPSQKRSGQAAGARGKGGGRRAEQEQRREYESEGDRHVSEHGQRHRERRGGDRSGHGDRQRRERSGRRHEEERAGQRDQPGDGNRQDVDAGRRTEVGHESPLGARPQYPGRLLVAKGRPDAPAARLRPLD